MSSNLPLPPGFAFRGVPQSLAAPGRKILVSAAAASRLSRPSKRIVIFDLFDGAGETPDASAEGALVLDAGDLIVDVEAIVALAAEGALLERIRAACSSARPDGVAAVLVDDPEEVEGVLADVLSSSLDRAEADAARAACASAVLRADHRRVHKAADRLRTLMEHAGIDIALSGAAKISPSDDLAPIPMERLRQRLPDYHPYLRLVRVEVRPALSTFEESTGLMTATITAEGSAAIVSQVSVAPAFIADGILEIAIPTSSEPRGALWLTLDWDGLPALAPKAALGRHGLGPAFDVVGGEPATATAGAMLAASYLSGYVEVEPVPPAHTIVAPAPATSEWRTLPPPRLASARLLTPSPDTMEVSLCVFEHLGGKLLVHPVEGGGVTWAAVPGALAPGAKVVEAEVSLGPQAVGQVEFALLMTRTGHESEVIANSRSATWTRLSKGERTLVRWGPARLPAGSISLLFGTRMADEKASSWWAHARFERVRFTSRSDPPARALPARDASGQPLAEGRLPAEGRPAERAFEGAPTATS